MTASEIISLKRRAERVLNGDAEYDGADAARDIVRLCDYLLDEKGEQKRYMAERNERWGV